MGCLLIRVSEKRASFFTSDLNIQWRVPSVCQYRAAIPESDDEMDLHAVHEAGGGHYLDEFRDPAVYCEYGRCVTDILGVMGSTCEKYNFWGRPHLSHVSR